MTTDVATSLHDRAVRVIPGGVNSGQRQLPGIAGLADVPIRLEHASLPIEKIQSIVRAHPFRRAVNARQNIVSRHQHWRNEGMHGLAVSSGHGKLFDRARTDSLGVAKIHRVNLFNAFSPNRAGLDLQSKRDE